MDGFKIFVESAGNHVYVFVHWTMESCGYGWIFFGDFWMVMDGPICETEVIKFKAFQGGSGDSVIDQSATGI